VVRRQQLVDGLGHHGVFRQLRAFAPKPALEVCHEGRRQLPADLQPRLRRLAVDAALDLEQGIDPPDGFQGDGGDILGRLALADVGLDVGKLEELAPRVAPAQCRGYRPGLPPRVVERVVAGTGVGLQDPRPALQVFLRMEQVPGAATITRSRGRWSGKAFFTGLRRSKASTVARQSGCDSALPHLSCSRMV